MAPGAYCLLDAEGACGDHEEADDDELKHPDPFDNLSRACARLLRRTGAGGEDGQLVDEVCHF